MNKKDESEYFNILLISLIIFVFLLHVMTYLHLSVNTTRYTKTTGVVVEKYIKRYRTNGRVSKHRYLKVKYTYNGEEKIAEGIPANIWEGEGSTIHLFFCSDGSAARNLCVTDFEIILLICAMLYLASDWVKKRIELSTAQSSSVGTVIYDYDIPLVDEPADLKQKGVPNQPVFELYTEEEYKRLKSGNKA